MLIRLAILDSDQSYINRVVPALLMKYADKLEIFSFTDENKAIAAIDAHKINVMLVSGEFKVDIRDIRADCGLAYLVESRDIERYNGQRAVCKFQKAELIYKTVTDIYADSLSDNTIVGGAVGNLPVYLFTSGGGGAGATTVAIAVARALAAAGKRPLYMSFENFGSSDIYFSGDGQSHFGDVIYAVKSKKANLALKLESAAKRDESGVYYYSESSNALDTQELSGDEIALLFTALRQSDFCDCVVADVNLSVDRRVVSLIGLSERVVLVSDGSDVSNAKLRRAYDALGILEKSANIPVLRKLAVFYDKFSNKIGAEINIAEIVSLGGAPRYEHLTAPMIAQKLFADNAVAKVVSFLIGGDA
jgi:cellulose biosynthesis protein BcsQ